VVLYRLQSFNFAEVVVHERSVTQPTIFEVCVEEVCAAKVCAAEICAAEICAAEICVVEVCAAEMCAAEMCATEVCADEVRAAEVWPNIFTRTTPLIPRLDPLLQNLKMFRVSHRGRSGEGYVKRGEDIRGGTECQRLRN
jgi:hypothetical protein